MYSTTSEAVIKKLKAHIARYGVPDEMVSDNGPQFAAEEFRVFAQRYSPLAHTTLNPMGRLSHPENGESKWREQVAMTSIWLS